MQKVGTTTGRTKGTVTGTCVAQLQGGSTNFTTCTNLASFAVAPGDSGSPVYRNVNGALLNPDLEIYGVVWGGTLAGGSFSPVGSIQTNLGGGEPKFTPNDEQGLSIAFAVTVGPHGEVYAGGIGLTNHPAFAWISG